MCPLSIATGARAARAPAGVDASRRVINSAQKPPTYEVGGSKYPHCRPPVCQACLWSTTVGHQIMKAIPETMRTTVIRMGHCRSHHFR